MWVRCHILGRRTSCVLPCPALSCPALSCQPCPACQFVFPLRGCFCLFYLGLCDVDKKNLSRFLDFFSISILITILTQTDMLYSYKCILCEFETYFQRKPIRPFLKSCNMSLEQTYGKIYIYIIFICE